MDKLQLVRIVKTRKILAAIIAASIVGFLLSPLPGIEAVLLELDAFNTSFSSSTNIQKLFVDVLKDINDNDPNPGLSAEGNWNLEETIPSNAIIEVIIDGGTSSEQKCRTTMLGGNVRSDSTSCTGVSSITLKRVSDDFDNNANDYDYFGYGYFYLYSYGYKYVAPDTYTYARFGNGTYVYGLTAHNDGRSTFAGDVTAEYHVNMIPGGMSSGSHTIKFVIFNPADTTQFFKSSEIGTFTNTLPEVDEDEVVPTAGAAFTVSSSKPTLKLASTVLPSTIAASTTATTLDFSSLVAAGGELTITGGTVATSTIGGLAVTFQLPAGTTIDFPAGVNAFALPTASTASATGLGTAGVVISMGGANSERFTFTSAVRLLVPGEASEGAFFVGTNSAGSVVTREITAACTADDQATVDAQLVLGGTEDCKIDVGGDLVIWTKHASSFGSFSGGGGDGGGGDGTGGAGGGGGGGAGGGGIAGIPGVDQARLYEVSWDLCESNIVKIIAGPPSEGLNVKLRTAKSGVVKATMVDDESLPGRAIYEAVVSPDETFIFVQVEGFSGRNASVAQKSISISECSGSITVEEYKPPTTVSEKAPSLPAPSMALDSMFIAPQLTGGISFKTLYADTELVLSYRFSNAGTITAMDIDEDSKSVTFALADVEEGVLTLAIPRGLVDAENNEFVVLVSASEAQQIDYSVVESTANYVTFKVDLPEGATALTIIGTSVIPEFGSLAMLVLAAPILILVAMTRRLKKITPQN